MLVGTSTKMLNLVLIWRTNKTWTPGQLLSSWVETTIRLLPVICAGDLEFFDLLQQLTEG